MEKKGLCGTCIQVKSCIFTKNSPVWQCEEFSDFVPGINGRKTKDVLKAKNSGVCSEAE